MCTGAPQCPQAKAWEKTESQFQDRPVVDMRPALSSEQDLCTGLLRSPHLALRIAHFTKEHGTRHHGRQSQCLGDIYCTMWGIQDEESWGGTREQRELTKLGGCRWRLKAPRSTMSIFNGMGGRGGWGAPS